MLVGQEPQEPPPHRAPFEELLLRTDNFCRHIQIVTLQKHNVTLLPQMPRVWPKTLPELHMRNM